MLNSHQDAVRHAGHRALQEAMRRTGPAHPLSTSITALMKHGGLYSLMDKDIMHARLSTLVPSNEAADAALTLSQTASSFFTYLVPDQPYVIPNALMSYLVLPHEGTTYTDDGKEEREPGEFVSPDIPAIFTFIGQFIDHDLTMNAIDLFLPQSQTTSASEPTLPPTPNPIVDGATPLIDLDSVYGPRTTLASPPSQVFDGKLFNLVGSGNEFDLPRDATGSAVISDHRNDENQMILQVHLLVERMHNKFAQTMDFDQARQQTILNWQFMILHDYLPRIVQADVLEHVVTEILKPGHGDLKFKPTPVDGGTPQVRMPHEFAIAFRFGHSQLKRAYKLNNHAPYSLLFDNLLTGTGPNGTEFDDLRGTQTLRDKNRIDWHLFFPTEHPVLSNLIDRQVTARAFNLPKSAIPDDITYVGNLPHRNLIRSRQLGLCSGEALAAFYGVPALTPDQVEPSGERHGLFMANEARAAGADAVFETPLWYYILREAELSHGMPGNAAKLGPLGSRLVAEVIVGAIAYADLSVLRPPPPFTPLPGAQPVPQHGPNDYLRTIVKWVNGFASL